MLQILWAVIARCAIVAAFALIVGQIAPSLPRNKVYRFILFFVLCVPLNVVIDYVNAWTLRYEKTGWTWNLILALLVAAWLTFLPLEPHDSVAP